MLEGYAYPYFADEEINVDSTWEVVSDLRNLILSLLNASPKFLAQGSAQDAIYITSVAQEWLTRNII